MGGGNPFATNMMMVQPNNPISYQNKNHNVNPYQNQSNQRNDPFAGAEGKGPSEAGWQRDAHDLGFNHVSFNVKKEEKDDIKEFKDLFSLGSKTFTTNQN